ncbi:MAG TPA: NTPase [Desulfatiglandales bacterium]|nr:NTPase [Desulfatiglandales bacterium]
MIRKNVFVTGSPRCGKSTLIQKVLEKLNGPATGFFTREMREGGERLGFSINTVDGREGILAHKSIRSRYRVGKYGVNLKDIDDIAVPAMIPSGQEQIVVIDEIGKMECFSPLFKQALIEVLDSPNRVLGSIALRGDSFIEAVKRREDVMAISVTIQNRDILVNQLLDTVKAFNIA